MTAVRFILNGERIELEVSDPTRTLLQYLREDLRRTGSKEGCAEGDCGACTVVIDGRAENACLLTLDASAGCSIEEAHRSAPSGSESTTR